MANLDMKALNSTDATEKNNSLSGKYLVQSAVYDVDEGGTLTTLLKLVKFDWDTATRPTEARDIPQTVLDLNNGGAQ